MPILTPFDRSASTAKWPGSGISFLQLQADLLDSPIHAARQNDPNAGRAARGRAGLWPSPAAGVRTPTSENIGTFSPDCDQAWREHAGCAGEAAVDCVIVLAGTSKHRSPDALNQERASFSALVNEVRRTS